MLLKNEVQLDYNDVLILPKRSTLKSRKDVILERTYKFKHTGKQWNGIGIIAANMMTGSFEMAVKLAQYNMLTALHKHYSLLELVNFWTVHNKIAENNTFYTLGIRPEDYEKYNNFLIACREQFNDAKWTPNFICIDAPSFHIEIAVDFLKKFRKENPNTIIMAGNVADGSMTEELILSGADIVKAGIGGGAQCWTRKMTNIGRPMLSTVIETADASHGLKGFVTADGGCVDPGDICTAFAAGADFVMCGSMFSGTDECLGDIIEHNGINHKQFFGMSSTSAMNQFGNGKADYKASEGRTTLVPCKGSVSYVVEEILGGLRSMLSYIGAEKLKEAPKRATLIRVNNRLNQSFEKYTIGN